MSLVDDFNMLSDADKAQIAMLAEIKAKWDVALQQPLQAPSLEPQHMVLQCNTPRQGEEGEA